jgi:hypothetical protein
VQFTPTEVVEVYKSLLLNIAVYSGWITVIAHGFAWYARRKFRALLKAPLTDEVENLTHLWERQIARWTATGHFMSGLSILCCIVWLVV